MRAVLLLTVAAAACIALAWWVSLLPGMVSATVAGTTFEASTPVALTLLGLLFVVLYIVFRFLGGLARSPRTARRWRMSRNRLRGDAAVTRALVALAANDAGAARREADRSRRLLGDTPLTLLLAAQAGRQAGRDVEAEAAFRLLAEHKDGRLIGLRGLLRQAVHRQDWPAATALAAQAESTHPGAAWLREERRHMALRTGQWKEALRLSGAEHRAALAVAAAEGEADPAAALKLARQGWEADPALPVTAVAYASRLRGAGKARAAGDVLRKAWALAPHPDIATEYLAAAADKLGRRESAAALAGANPGHPDSFMLMAQVALEAGLTNEARGYVENARAAGLNQRRAWVLLAEIAELDGDAAGAQDALRHVAAADPDPVWRCGNCGTVHAQWHPSCDACGATASITWAQPDRVPPGSGQGQLPRLPEPEDVEGLP